MEVAVGLVLFAAPIAIGVIIGYRQAIGQNLVAAFQIIRARFDISDAEDDDRPGAI